jgi:hypothetical protein
MVRILVFSATLFQADSQTEIETVVRASVCVATCSFACVRVGCSGRGAGCREYKTQQK